MSAARAASPGGSLERPASRPMCEDLEATNDVSRQPQQAREGL
jgi:hypothetical protein